MRITSKYSRGINIVIQAFRMVLPCMIQSGPGLVQLRFGRGTVQVVPVFGSDGSSGERVSCISVQSQQQGMVSVF